MINIRENEDSFIIDFSEYEDWDGFDVIITKLKSEFNASVIEKIDGPESRVWHLKIEGIKLSLHNNPYGNYLKASTADSIEYLKNYVGKFRIVFY